jgi:hypothetical protein
VDEVLEALDGDALDALDADAEDDAEEEAVDAEAGGAWEGVLL